VKKKKSSLFRERDHSSSLRDRLTRREREKDFCESRIPCRNTLEYGDTRYDPDSKTMSLRTGLRLLRDGRIPFDTTKDTNFAA